MMMRSNNQNTARTDERAADDNVVPLPLNERTPDRRQADQPQEQDDNPGPTAA